MGRQHQLALVIQRLKEAEDGHGCFISISGEPGIGKTRLAQASADAAKSLGFDVHWGFCHEGQYIPTFWPWTQILGDMMNKPLGSLDRVRNRAALRSLGDVAINGSRRPGDKGLPKPLTPRARLGLIESFLSLLKSVSQRRPLLLVMENLHCADPSSLQLLEIVAKELSLRRAVIIASHREGHTGTGGALGGTLGSIAGQSFFEEITLHGFNLSEVGQYLGACGIQSPPSNLVQAVFEQTEGNPLFVVETAAWLLRNGPFRDSATGGAQEWKVHIPPKVRLAIVGLVQKLSDRCRDMISAAAILGREFDLAVLAEVLQEKESILASVLEEAVACSLIEETHQGPRRYRFLHAQVHEVVSKEIPASRSSELHLRAGEALERRLGSRAEGYASALARHFDAAGSPFADKALRYYRIAGERALRVYGFQDAFSQLTMALELLQDRDEPLVAARLLFGLAQSLQGLGNIKAGAESYRKAFDLFLQQEHVEDAIRVLEQPLILFDKACGMRELFERALDLLEAGSPRAQALGGKYGLALYRDTGDYQRAVGILVNALDAVKGTGDREQEKATLINLGWIEYHELHFDKAHRMAESVLRLAQEDRDFWTEGMARSIDGLALLGLGRVSEAEEHARRTESLAEKYSIRFVRSGVSALLFALERQKGDLEAASRTSDAFPGTDTEPYQLWHTINRALLQLERGESTATPQLMKEIQDRQEAANVPPHWNGSLALVIAYLAWTSRVPGDIAAAESMAAKVLSDGGLRRGEFVTATAALGLTDVLHGAQDSAARRYELLLPYRGLVISPPLGLSSDHLLGLLSFTAGADAQARRHFDEALSFCRAGGLLVELAYTCRDYAGFLQRTMGNARSPAADLCREAGGIAERSGLLLLTDQIKAIRQKSDLDAGGPSAYPDSLSEREVEVLRLLSKGLSNAVIGERLFISPHTVANHVKSILEKTGAANRTEAAAHAVRNGLVETASSNQ